MSSRNSHEALDSYFSSYGRIDEAEDLPSQQLTRSTKKSIRRTLNRSSNNGAVAAEQLEDRQLLTSTLVSADFTGGNYDGLDVITGSQTPKAISFQNDAVTLGARQALFTNEEFSAATPDQPLTFSGTFTLAQGDSLYTLLRADATTQANGYHSLNEFQIEFHANGISMVESQNGNKSTLASTASSIPINTPLTFQITDTGTSVTATIPELNLTLQATPAGSYPKNHVGVRNWDGNTVVDNFLAKYGASSEQSDASSSSNSNNEQSNESVQSAPGIFALTADNWTAENGTINITADGAYIPRLNPRLVSNQRYTVNETTNHYTEVSFTLNSNSTFVAMFESDAGSKDRLSVEADGELNHFKIHKKMSGSTTIVHRETGMPFNDNTPFTIRVTQTAKDYKVILLDENNVELDSFLLPFANTAGTHQVQLRTAGEAGGTVLATSGYSVDISEQVAEALRKQQEAAPYVADVVNTDFQNLQLPAGMSITPNGAHEYTGMRQLRMHNTTGLQLDEPIVPTADAVLYAESEFRIFQADTYQVNIHATNDYGSNGHSSMLSAEATINDNGDGFLRVTQTINGQQIVLSQQGLALDVSQSYKIVVSSNGENVFAELWSADGVQLATLNAEVASELQNNGYGSVQQNSSRVFVNSLHIQTINPSPTGVEGIVPAHVLRKLPAPQAIQYYMNAMSDVSDRMSSARSTVDSGAFALMSDTEQGQLRTQAATDLQLFAALQDGFTEYSLESLQNEQVDTIDLSSFNNATIQNAGFHRQMLLTLDNLGGTADVRLWKGKINNDALSVEEGVITSTGSGLSIDLAQAASFTTGMQFTVHSAEGMLEITYYRGDEIVGTRIANDGDVVSFSDEEGITGAVLSRFDSGASLNSFNISDLSVTGTKNQNQTTVNPLNTIYNTQVSLLAAPDWTGGLSYDELKAIADANRVAFSFYDGAWNPDWYKFARGTNAPYQMMFPEQNGAIEQHPYYISPTGPKPIPSEFFQVPDGQRAIIAAGAPTDFLLTKLPYFSTGNQFGLQNGESYSDVAPANAVDVHVNYLQARPIGTDGEGFVGILPNPQKPDRAVGTAKYHFNITNEGQKGGQVTVKVYAGYGSASQLTHTYTDSLGAYETKGLIVPVDPQGSNIAADGETILRGVYRIEVTYPDGRSAVLAQGMTREHHEAPKLGSAGDPNRANYDAYVRNTIDDAQLRINDGVARGQEGGAEDFFSTLNPDLKPAVISGLDGPARRVVFATLSDADKADIWGKMVNEAQADVFDLLPVGQQAVAFADLSLESRELVWRSMTRAEKDRVTEHSKNIASAMGHAPDASYDGRFQNLARDQYFAKDEAGNDVVVLVVGDRHVPVRYEAGKEQTNSMQQVFVEGKYEVAVNAAVLGVSYSEVVTSSLDPEKLKGTKNANEDFVSVELGEKFNLTMSINAPEDGMYRLYLNATSAKQWDVNTALVTVTDPASSVSTTSTVSTTMTDQPSSWLSAHSFQTGFVNLVSYVENQLDTTPYGYEIRDVYLKTGDNEVTLYDIVAPSQLDQNNFSLNAVHTQSGAATNVVNMPVLVNNHSQKFVSVQQVGESQYESTEAVLQQKTTWVVIHGRASDPTIDNMGNVYTAIQGAAPNDQILALDWQAYADQGLRPVVDDDGRMLEGLDYAPLIGEWAANELQAAGIASNQVILVGHSWGTLVGYQIAERMNGNVRSYVVLDTATDFDNAPINLINNQLDTLQYDFRDVSDYVISLEGSFFGQDSRAVLADDSIKVVTDQSVGPFTKHSGIVDVFSKLINDKDSNIGKKFTPEKIVNGESPTNWTFNVLHQQPNGEGYEAQMNVFFDGKNTVINSMQYLDPTNQNEAVRLTAAGETREEAGQFQTHNLTAANPMNVSGWLGTLDTQDEYTFGISADETIEFTTDFDRFNLEIVDSNNNVVAVLKNAPLGLNTISYALPAGSYKVRILNILPDVFDDEEYNLDLNIR